MLNSEELRNMNIGDDWEDNYWHIARVPGGWLYTSKIYHTTTYVMIPGLNDEDT